MIRSSINQTTKHPLSKNVAILGELAHGSSLFRELFLSKGWKIELSVNSVEKLVLGMQTTKIGMIVLDDSRETPCSIFIRQLMIYPWFHLLPILCFTLPRHINDQVFLESFPMIYVVEKPMNWSKFDLALTKMSRQRDKRSYARAFDVIDAFLLRSVDLGEVLTHLKTLESYEEIKKSILAVMVCLLIEHKMFSVAENLVSKELKVHGRDPFFMILLILVYIHGGLFQLAFRLLKNLMVVLRDPPCLFLDLAQIKILLDEPVESLSFLEKLVQWDYYASFAQEAVAHLHMSMEKPDLAHMALKDFPGFFKKLQVSWAHHQNQAVGSIKTVTSIKK